MKPTPERIRPSESAENRPAAEVVFGWPWKELALLVLNIKAFARRISSDEPRVISGEIHKQIEGYIEVIEKERDAIGRALIDPGNEFSVMSGLNDLFSMTYPEEEDWGSRIKKALMPLFLENMNLLVKIAERNDDSSVQAAKALVNVAVLESGSDSGNQDVANETRDFLNSKESAVFKSVEGLFSGQEGAERSVSGRKYIFMLEYFAWQADSPELRDRAIEAIASGFMNGPEPEKQAFDELVEILLRRTLTAKTIKNGEGKSTGSNIDIRDPGMSVIVKVCEHLKIDVEMLLKDWSKTDYDYPTRAAYVAAESLKTMRDVESRAPGAVAYLRGKPFSVRHFDRYTADMLVDQFLERDNVDSPYGVVMFAYDDNGGAFRGEGRRLGAEYEQFKSLGYLVRIAEVQSVPDLAKKLITLDKSSGSSHPMSFMIVGGHGSGGVDKDGAKNLDWIRFGPAEIPRHLRTFFGEYFDGKGVQRLWEFLEDGAPIVLMSCSTGAKDGIAEALSKVEGVGEVTAPSKPAYVNYLKVTRGPTGKIAFKVDYDAGEDNDSRHVTMTYRNGELVSGE